MRIFDKMLLLGLSFPILLVLSLSSIPHFPSILVSTLSTLFPLQCIMLGTAWQREEDEANKDEPDVHESYDYENWRND